MDFFQFDRAPPDNLALNSSVATYNFNDISPTDSQADNMFRDHGIPPQMHINPGSIWSGPSQSATDVGLEKLLNNYPMSMAQYGQVTPPEDDDMTKMFGKRADSGASGMDVDAALGVSPGTSMSSNKRPSVRSSQKSRKDSRVSEDGLTGDKKDKYREKNRVAAAKCRAKKKEHTDHLEDTYRTQSAMNSALKQTEKSLRDELSYWRTQALQHTFCACHSIQEYNLRKAQSMAYGANHGTASSPNLTNGRSSSSSLKRIRSSSAGEIVSPVMSDASGSSGVYNDSSKRFLGGSPVASYPGMSDMEIKEIAEC